MRRGTCRIVIRLATLVCPPEDLDTVLPAVVNNVSEHVRLLPPLARYGMGPALQVFDQAARIRSRGRRFVRLDDDPADAYLRRVLCEHDGPVAMLVRLVKGLIALSYYEQPAVTARLRYDPSTYIAMVSARRLALHGGQIGHSQ
jgi:hypothetical protein